MDRTTLIEELKKKYNLEVYIALVMTDNSVIPLLFDLIEQDKSSLKFLCEKIIRELSQEKPELLYPYFERMSQLLDSENNFIKWGFILSLPNMLTVDQEHKWEKISKQFYALIDSNSIVVFGNFVSGLPIILNKHPEDEDFIMSKLLSIENHVFLHKNEVSPECINVAIGHIINYFDKIYAKSNYKQEMITFAQKNLNNDRYPVRRKAKAFLKKQLTI
jgi:hypothetical protein